jgi:threonine dehydrogenase-like Zn-dependent dehydrogenase
MNRKSVTYIGSNIYTRGEFDEVIGAIADGRIGEPERMITGRVGMGEAVRGGFEELVGKGGRERHVKILVDPWG